MSEARKHLETEVKAAKYLKESTVMVSVDHLDTLLKASPPSGGEPVKYWVREYPDGHNCFCDNPEIVAVAPSTWKPLYTSKRVVDEAMVQRLAIHMATKESAYCVTLDSAVNHVNNWKRLIPEATEALQAALEKP